MITNWHYLQTTIQIYNVPTIVIDEISDNLTTRGYFSHRIHIPILTIHNKILQSNYHFSLLQLIFKLPRL